jgi:hypothetical protein
MSVAVVDRSDAWSLPWHELQHELALGFRLEPIPRTGTVPHARTQARSASSWLRRAHEQAEDPTPAAA